MYFRQDLIERVNCNNIHNYFTINMYYIIHFTLHTFLLLNHVKHDKKFDFGKI